MSGKMDISRLAALMATKAFSEAVCREQLETFLAEDDWNNIDSDSRETTNQICGAIREERPDDIPTIVAEIIPMLGWTDENGGLSHSTSTVDYSCFYQDEWNSYSTHRLIRTSQDLVVDVLNSLEHREGIDFDQAGCWILSYLELGDMEAFARLKPLLAEARQVLAEKKWPWAAYSWYGPPEVLARHLELWLSPFGTDEEKLGWIGESCKQLRNYGSGKEMLQAARGWVERQLGEVEVPAIETDPERGYRIEDLEAAFELAYVLKQKLPDRFEGFIAPVIGELEPLDARRALDALEVVEQRVELELEDYKGKKYWHLLRMGPATFTHSGNAGKEGRLNYKVHKDVNKAEAFFEKQVAKKRKDWKLDAAEVKEKEAKPKPAPAGDWRAQLGALSLPKKFPRAIDAKKLPTLKTASGDGLDADEVRGLLAALHASNPDESHPALVGIRERLDARSAGAFAWEIFQAWTKLGSPSREKWCLFSMGFLGDDKVALDFAPIIRAWPGQSAHARAVLGLQVYKLIGSDTALMTLSGISQKLKFKGLKQKAREQMDCIAAERGMTRQELEDRIVPDCGLDVDGGRVFDFGPRQFFFSLGQDLKPGVRDEEGKPLKSLPKPGKKDDAEQAEEAREDYKVLAKQVREALKIQVIRLELAMVTGRRWSPADFDALLLRHPLMSHLVQRVVWAIFERGELVGTFRVAEDRTLAGLGDEAVTPPASAEVGIAHPLLLDDNTRAAWSEIFADYEILPPFEQLSRPTYAVGVGEREATSIERFADRAVHPGSFRGHMEKTSWLKGMPEDAGEIYEFTKPFPAAGQTAAINISGINAGGMEYDEDVTIESLYFLEGQHEQGTYGAKDALPLARVDPVVFSEAVYDIQRLVDRLQD
jgi:hypothetical protein